MNVKTGFISVIMFVLIMATVSAVPIKSVFNNASISGLNVLTLSSNNIAISYIDAENNNGTFVIYDSTGNEVLGKTLYHGDSEWISGEAVMTEFDSTNIAITYGNTTGLTELITAVYDTSGNLISSNKIHDCHAYSLRATSLSNNNYAVAYSGCSNFAYLTIADESGNIIVDAVDVSNSIAGGPKGIGQFDDGKIFILYQVDSGEAYFTIYNESGNLTKSPTLIGSSTNAFATITNSSYAFVTYKNTDFNSQNFIGYDSDGNEVIAEKYFHPRQAMNCVPQIFTNATIGILCSEAGYSTNMNKFLSIVNESGDIIQNSTFLDLNISGYQPFSLHNDNLFGSVHRDRNNSDYGTIVINPDVYVPFTNTAPETPTILYPTENLSINATEVLFQSTFPADIDGDNITLYYYFNDTFHSTQDGNVTLDGYIFGTYGNFKVSISLYDGTDFSDNATVNYRLYNGTEEAPEMTPPMVDSSSISNSTPQEDDVITLNATCTDIDTGVYLMSIANNATGTLLNVSSNIFANISTTAFGYEHTVVLGTVIHVYTCVDGLLNSIQSNDIMYVSTALPEAPPITGLATLENDPVYSATSSLIVIALIISVFVILLVGVYQDMKSKRKGGPK